MPSHYEVVIVGGGVGGAALARSLAAAGVRVLVLEQTREFMDRVRGENFTTWGVAEAQKMELLDLFCDTCAHRQPWLDAYLGPHPLFHRDLTATTPFGLPSINLSHPAMQQTLLDAAADAGAEIRRGTILRDIGRHSTPAVAFEENGKVEDVRARLVVAADGRGSNARRICGFDVKRDSPFLLIAGVLLDGIEIAEDTGQLYMNPQISYGAYLFPQGAGRVRAYCAWPVDSGFRLQGEQDLTRFIETSVKAGAPAEIYEGVECAGPLASFEASDTWVDHPFADGVALVGDAAASTDPSWGQGLSVTMRDARVLRDCLLAHNDWKEAGNAYADAHDRHYGVIHEPTLALKRMFMQPGPEADALRACALPRIAEDPTRVPDHIIAGPDLPWNDEVLDAFFARDAAQQ